MVRLVAVESRGAHARVSRCPPKLTERDVDLIRELHEEHGLSYLALARKFEVSKSLVAKVCRYERRVPLLPRADWARR